MQSQLVIFCQFLILSTSPGFYMYMSAILIFENTALKREIAHNKQFLLFRNNFLPYWRHSFSHNVFNPFKTKIIVLATVIFSSANAFSLDQAKGLTVYRMTKSVTLSS